MIEELRTALKTPLSEPITTSWQVTACEEWRKAEKALIEAKGRFYDPSGRTDTERKIKLAYDVREQQDLADTWQDLVMILKQQVEMGRPLK